MSFKTFSNILPSDVFQTACDIVLSCEVPWYFNPMNQFHTSDSRRTRWYHDVMRNEFNKKEETFLNDKLLPIVKLALSLSGQKLECLYRIRLGLLTFDNTLFCNDIHVDATYPHKVGLIYLTDSDGPTRFYKERYDVSSKLSCYEYAKQVLKNNFTVEMDNPCIANSMICFNGLQYHSSFSPTNVTRRAVINFNYSCHDDLIT